MDSDCLLLLSRDQGSKLGEYRSIVQCQESVLLGHAEELPGNGDVLAAQGGKRAVERKVSMIIIRSE